MELFDETLFNEYMVFKDANKGFTWWDYLNVKSDSQTALIFSKFFYPEIIEVDGCFLLKDRYDPKIYEGWKKDCQNDKTCIEKMVNLFELQDFFNYNINEDENYEEQVKKLGDVLQFFWSMSFKHRYPDRSITVAIDEEWDSLFITVFEEIGA